MDQTEPEKHTSVFQTLLLLSVITSWQAIEDGLPCSAQLRGPSRPCHCVLHDMGIRSSRNFFKYVFIWLHQVLVAACRVFELQHANSQL